MNKITALLQLFRRGSAMAEPGAIQNSAVIAAVIVAIASTATAFGYPLPIDDQIAQAIAGGVAALAGVVLTITSEHVGLPYRSGSTATAGQHADPTPVPANPAADFPNLPGAD
jgi:hypothetical protein